MRANLANLLGVVTEDQQVDDPSEERRRLQRMKHLKVDDYTFADMVPMLLAENLISEHGNHAARPPRNMGRRSDERNAELCGHCEHLIREQWARNVKNLTADQARMFEASFVWINQAVRRAIKCESMVTQKVEIVTEKRRRIENADGKPTDDFLVEVTTRRETRLYPEFMNIAVGLRRDIARLSGVPVGDVGKEIDPDKSKRGGRKVMRVSERTEPAELEN